MLCSNTRVAGLNLLLARLAVCQWLNGHWQAVNDLLLSRCHKATEHNRPDSICESELSNRWGVPFHGIDLARSIKRDLLFSVPRIENEHSLALHFIGS